MAKKKAISRLGREDAKPVNRDTRCLDREDMILYKEDCRPSRKDWMACAPVISTSFHTLSTFPSDR